MTLLLLLGTTDVYVHEPLEVEAELGGRGLGWTNISRDVQRVPSVSLNYGLPGGGPLDLVAPTGRLSFALNNGADNSGSLLGWYSPQHANCRSGWGLGIGIRLVYRVGGAAPTYYKFSGTVDSIDPISGRYGERKVMVGAVDFMDAAARFAPNVSTQVTKRADEILTALVAAIPRQPIATSFGTGVSTFAYALDTDQNEAEPALTVFQRLAQSEYGRVYVKGDQSTGGVLTFEPRTARLTPTVAAQFNDTMVSLSAPQDLSVLINKIRATTHPRTVDTAATTVLFTLAQVNPSIHSVVAGGTITIEGLYTDAANRTARVGGTDMVVPVATTDYTMNTLAGGGGTDLTASFNVTATFGANRVSYVITNGSASAGFITKLQARGRGLYDFGAVDYVATSSSSVTAYGEAPLSLDMAYESALPSAQGVADYILGVWSGPGAISATMSLTPADSAALTTAMALEPGQAIGVMETVTGIASTYFIQAVSMTFEMFHTVAIEWVLQRAQVADYFTLDSATLGQLDENVVAPL